MEEKGWALNQRFRRFKSKKPGIYANQVVLHIMRTYSLVYL